MPKKVAKDDADRRPGELATWRTSDQARVTVSVAVGPDEALRVITEEVQLWWGDLLGKLRALAASGSIDALRPATDDDPTAR